MTDDESNAGDPPCWAHLFDDASHPGEEASATGSVGDAAGPVDLAGPARSGPARGAIRTHRGEDLNANLLEFRAGEGVAENVNAEVDVLLVGIAGEGAVDIDGTRRICGSDRR